MKKILISIGTRPEVIKTAMLIKLIQTDYSENLSVVVVSTGQHNTMLKQMLDFFGIKPDYEMNIMTANQTLANISSLVLTKIDKILKDELPDIVLVQGDTTTAFISALAAFYNKIPIGHIEAGLRTYDKFQPFPEEINRQFIDKISELLFAPTQKNYNNLIAENFDKKRIFITGNTGIDSLFYIKNQIQKSEDFKTVLITAHRRENFGNGIKDICIAIKNLAEKFENHNFIYPVHKNPNIQNPVKKILSDIKNVKLIEPLPYLEFTKLLINSVLVLTDSGGVQEESTTLGIPTLVLRNITERNEGVEANILKIVGTDTQKIINESSKILSNPQKYIQNSLRKIYGDGNASRKILEIIRTKI